jgi:hypothetical protein
MVLRSKETHLATCLAFSSWNGNSHHSLSPSIVGTIRLNMDGLLSVHSQKFKNSCCYLQIRILRYKNP